MDFSFGAIMSGLIVSSIGMFLFMWGKGAGNMMHLGIGVVLMALPMFISSQILLWALTGVAMIPAWTLRHG